MTTTAMDSGTEQINYVAVTGMDSVCWILTFWRMAGPTTCSDLALAWGKAGLDEKLLPPAPTDGVALRRAMDDQATAKLLCRQGPDAIGGWALVQEDSSGEKLAHTTVCQARLAKDDGKLEIATEDEALMQRIALAFEAKRGAYQANDVSYHLSNRLLPVVNGVGLRERGGVYFVPRTGLDEWRRMVGAIRSVSSHRVFEIPALRSDEAVAAVLDAVQQEAEAAAREIEELMDNPEKGPRALTSAAERCVAIGQKVKSYEALLGANIEGLRARLDDLRGALTTEALLRGAAKGE
jgi:hypothetical protein